MATYIDGKLKTLDRVGDVGPALTGAKLKAERLRLRVSQTDLAARSGIDRGKVDRIERAAVHPDLTGVWQVLTQGQRVEPKKPKGAHRSTKGQTLPPVWLVMMLDLAEYAPPDDDAVVAFLVTIQALLGGAPADGPTRSTHPSAAKLFDARIRSMAAMFPRWLEALAAWIDNGTAARAHPLFANTGRRIRAAHNAMVQGAAPSKAFGLVKLGRPAGAVRRGGVVPMHIGMAAKPDDDAVRLAYLFGTAGMAGTEATKQAALICYGSNDGAAVVLTRKLAAAVATGAAEVHPSDMDANTEIAAIKHKYGAM